MTECEIHDKYVVNGKYAVIVHPGFGAGFSTWCDGVEAHNYRFIKYLFDKGYVKNNKIKVPRDKLKECESYLYSIIKKDGYVYIGGLNNSNIVWVDLDDDYIIEEYDGYESLIID